MQCKLFPCSFSYDSADRDVNNQLPRCGYKKVGDTIITKHDKEITGRANGKRIMDLDVNSGDGGGYDMVN